MTKTTVESAETESFVFAENRQWSGGESEAPVIVIGLPRSGTSFLSHVLTQLPDYYVFDDLYLLTQRAAKQAGDGTLSASALDKLLFFLGWQIRARHRFGLYAIPAVPEDRAEDLNDALRESFRKEPGNVLELQAEWLLRLARAKGAGQWGFKMPKAFLQTKRLFKAYPGVQMICLMRQPEDVLSSYKNMPLEVGGDGDPRRYHPLVYAFYWRLAARSYRKAAKDYPGRVHLVRFHEFIADPLATANEVAVHLGTQPAKEIVQPEKPNSSHKKGTKRPLTGLEAWLIRLICGREIKALGFETRPLPAFALSDPLDFLRSTFVCAGFHLGRIAARFRGSKASTA